MFAIRTPFESIISSHVDIVRNMRITLGMYKGNNMVEIDIFDDDNDNLFENIKFACSVFRQMMSKSKMSIYFSNGRTPLHLLDTAMVLEFFIEHGADVNARDDQDLTPLHKCSSLEKANILIKHGADVNATSDDGNTPLHICYDVDIAKLLIKHGANPLARNKYGMTPLHACEDLEVAKLLVNKYHSDINDRDYDGYTPLHVCVNPRVCEYLIKLGCDVNARSNNGDTPLHGIRPNFPGHPEIAALLIKYGANINAVNNYGERTSIMMVHEDSRLIRDKSLIEEYNGVRIAPLIKQ